MKMLQPDGLSERCRAISCWSEVREQAFLDYMDQWQDKDSILSPSCSVIGSNSDFTWPSKRIQESEENIDALLDNLEVVRSCQETIIQKLTTVSKYLYSHGREPNGAAYNMKYILGSEAS